jgi:hypothetical protein
VENAFTRRNCRVVDAVSVNVAPPPPPRAAKLKLCAILHATFGSLLSIFGKEGRSEVRNLPVALSTRPALLRLDVVLASFAADASQNFFE